MLLAYFLAVGLFNVLAAPDIQTWIPCSAESNIQISSSLCLSLGCEVRPTSGCSLSAGYLNVISQQLPEGAPRPVHHYTEPLTLVAAFDIALSASGHLSDTSAYFSLHQNKLTVTVVTPSEERALNSVRIFGFPESLRPRSLRLNGRPLRRGDLYYHRDSQSLELFDLQIPLSQDFVLEFVNQAESRADDKIECPVTYADRDAEGRIPQTACFSPCLWEEDACWMPPLSQYGYKVNGLRQITEFGVAIPLQKIGDDLYGAPIKNIVFELFVYRKNLLRIKLYDPNNKRYEVPLPKYLPQIPPTEMPDFDVLYSSIEGAPFRIQVVRISTGTVIFDTTAAGVTFEDQLLSVALRLPSRNLYGIGESYHSTFRRKLDDTTWPLFARDEPPSTDKITNLYGVHPFYECVENDGKAHGVLLLNSNAMDYQLSSLPAVVYRTIGGILDFYIMTGPSSEEVIAQYTSLIGKPFLPPYWALGFQLSRYGFNNLQNMKNAIERTKNCSIPLDVFYGDIDTMDKKGDFTIDPINYAGLSEFVDEQRAQGLRYVPILDPAIPSGRENYGPFERGLEADAFIRWEPEFTGDVLLGSVWPPEPVGFPDFFKKSTKTWWTDEIKRFYNIIKFDGLWIDMNEPANFNTNIKIPGQYTLQCRTTPWDDPPYLPKSGTLGPTNRINDKTICMSVGQGDNDQYRHYDVHSLYGWSETEPTSKALQAVTGKRGLVFTRSSYVGSGRYGGHWTGDNAATWEHLRYSVIGLLDFNLFGIPYVGADICGHFNDAEERLCERWMELGAFYPFSRNHNAMGTTEQDPCMWPDTVGSSARTAMMTRYRLLPYFYSVFFMVQLGEEATVIRSLMHEFPADRASLEVDQQFLWGDGLMVSPVLEEGATTVNAYFPEDMWYDFYSGLPYPSNGRYIALNAPTNHIPLHVRGGRIIPLQKPAMTTTESRKNPFDAIIALNSKQSAFGHLYWDYGESLETIPTRNYHHSILRFEDDMFKNYVENFNHGLMRYYFIEDLEIFGVNGRIPSKLVVNRVENMGAIFKYTPVFDKLEVFNAHLALHEDFVAQFIYD